MAGLAINHMHAGVQPNRAQAQPAGYRCNVGGSSGMADRVAANQASATPVHQTAEAPAPGTTALALKCMVVVSLCSILSAALSAGLVFVLVQTGQPAATSDAGETTLKSRSLSIELTVAGPATAPRVNAAPPRPAFNR